MGAIAFAPSSPSLVYAGTGEPNFRGDDYAGQGLLVSHNGGTNWAMLNSSFAETSFSHIKVNASDPSKLVVATVRGGGGVADAAAGTNGIPGAPPRGIFTSTSGGTSFTRVLTGEATALDADPTDFSNQYAGLGEIYGAATNGIYRTTNGWASSELISGPWTSVATPDEMGRMAIAIAPSDHNTVYVGVSGKRSAYISSLLGIWMTRNAWAASPTWTPLPLSVEAQNLPETPDQPRFWYYFELLVDPTDRDTLYLAQYDVLRYRSPNWTPLTKSIHPDNHAMAWVPGIGGQYRMLLGNDGGVWFSDLGVLGYWQGLNASLATLQVYKGAVDPTGDSALALAGLQDNFTEMNVGTLAWSYALGGDGADCAISAAKSATDWAMSIASDYNSETHNPEVEIFRTLDGGKNHTFASGDITSDVLDFSQQFFVHFEKAPYNDDLFIAGTTRLWRCDDFFSATTPSWSINSPVMLDAGSHPVAISTMAFAPSDTSGMIYAFGTEDGQLRITLNGGLSWHDLDPVNAVPGRYISGLAFSPTNASILYVTLSGFNEGTPGYPGHLFKTSNALAGTPVWTDFSPPVNLPNNCLAIDPNRPGTILVGTDLGVWTTSNGGGTWSHYGPSSGMPNVAVFDLRFNAVSQATAFTHGRSAYTLVDFGIPILILAAPPGCDVCPPPPPCLSCPFGEGWLNPGDLVTVVFQLQNEVPVDTVDLQATMLPTQDITPVTTTQSYGVVRGQGAPVGRAFSFRTSPTTRSRCGNTVQVALQLSDRGTNLGLVKIPFRLGTPAYPFSEDFESVPQGGLPTGWTSTGVGADVAWTVTTNPPPNVFTPGEDELPDPASNASIFTPDTFGYGESLLTTPPFLVAGSQAQLYFRQAFDMPDLFDGCILEIAVGGQPFVDIQQAGGSFAQDGYDQVLNGQNPLGIRAAWSGDSGGWMPVWVNLPPTAAGQPVQFRWHFGSLVGMTNGGWFIDTVRVIDPLCLPPVLNPVILNPTVTGNIFAFSINTVTNRTYILEYKANLTDPAWQFLQTLAGDGSQQTVQTSLTTPGQRFYRFRVR
jgi:hypothetical protein